MLYSEIRKKEVVNMRDCRKLGRVVDIDIDECNGCIRRIKVSDRIRCFHCHGMKTARGLSLAL